ncbi:MAG TPA: caspase family protein, partial [Blastocatellia bacterium]|nr:caspase family protein [Blastocatellia bacterium]
MGPAKRQPKHSFLSSKRFAFITSAVIAGVFAIAGCAPSFGQDQAQPRTWVLVIGISQYSKLPGGQQLLDAENDARAFANVLQARSNIDLKNMWLMIGPAATQTAIKTGLGSWLARQSSEQDTVYIFFSGHAVVDREFGAPYWLAYDSDPKNVDATAISLDDLKHSLGRVKAGRIIIIQDS